MRAFGRITSWGAPLLSASAIIAGVALLSACAATPGLNDTPSKALAVTDAPVPVAGYDWFLNDDPEEPRLSYGEASSDDAPLSLMCAPGSGKVSLSLMAGASPARAVTLESGNASGTYPAKVEDAEMHDGSYLVASTAISDPVMQSFRTLGWLAVRQDDRLWTMAAQPGSEKRAGSFLDLCR